jgi:hypothetical protein
MKLTRKEAQQQAKRIAANPMLIPQTDDGAKELVDCLIRHCANTDHAERAMTAFLDGARDPKNLTAELAACAAATRQADSLPPGCERCRYEDPETGETRYRSHLSRTVRGYDVSQRCTCERGQALAAGDRRRDEELRKTHNSLGGVA